MMLPRMLCREVKWQLKMEAGTRACLRGLDCGLSMSGNASELPPSADGASANACHSGKTFLAVGHCRLCATRYKPSALHDAPILVGESPGGPGQSSAHSDLGIYHEHV